MTLIKSAGKEVIIMRITGNIEKAKFVKVNALDNYKLSPTYGKRVEFITELNEAGKQRISLYGDVKIIDSWDEYFGGAAV